MIAKVIRFIKFEVLNGKYIITKYDINTYCIMITVQSGLTRKKKIIILVRHYFVSTKPVLNVLIYLGIFIPLLIIGSSLCPTREHQPTG